MSIIVFWYFLILCLCCIYLAKKAYQQSENESQRFEDVHERCMELTKEKSDIQVKMINMGETIRELKLENQRLENELLMYLGTGKFRGN